MCENLFLAFYNKIPRTSRGIVSAFKLAYDFIYVLNRLLVLFYQLVKLAYHIARYTRFFVYALRITLVIRYNSA